MSKKEILAPGDLQNPLKLAKPLLAAVIGEFTLLRELKPSLAEKVIRYVVDGTEPSILLELAGEKDALDAMSMIAQSTLGRGVKRYEAVTTARGKLLEAAGTSPPEFQVRLGEAYASIRQPHGGSGLAAVLPGAPGWLLALLMEIVIGGRLAKMKAWPISSVELLLRYAGLSTDLLVVPSLDRDFNMQVNSATGWYSAGWVNSFAGWRDYYKSHMAAVRLGLQPSDVDKRLYALDVIHTSKAPLNDVADLFVQMGCGASKMIREAVLQMLQEEIASNSDFLGIVRPIIEKMLSDGDAAQRNEAAILLSRLCGQQAKETLVAHAANETAPRVKQTIERLLSAPAGASTDDSESAVLLTSLPALQIPTGKLPLPESAKEELRATLQQKYEEAKKQFDATMERLKGADPKVQQWKPRPPTPIDFSELNKLFDAVETGNKPKGNKFQEHVWNLPYLKSWQPPDVNLVHVVRLLNAIGILNFQTHNNSFWLQSNTFLDGYRAQCSPPFGLRELDATIATLPEGKPGMAAMVYLSGNNEYRSTFDWEPDAIWPAFIELRQVLHGALGPSPNRGRNYSQYDYSFPEKRRNAFKVLAMLPALPQEFIPLLWDMALGDSKSDRLPAQKALATVEGKTERILQALQDGRQETRAAAADWLGRLQDPAAIEPLKSAFRKEKQEYVKGVYMAALEALGANVEEFLDRKKLLKEAEAGLAKKRPKGMDWFPEAALPAVHWQDTGKPVDPQILNWWVVQTVQQKSAVCGPLLRRYLQMCRPADAAALGKFILSAWIAQDTRNPTAEEAASKAAKDADQQFAQYGQNSWWQDYYKDRDNLYRMLLQQYSEQFLGSAIGEKGMLALVSATANADCVKLCEQYLRKYYGHRLAQCKALIEVLAWMKHPLAIQLLLSIGNRFRTKALRQAANEHVQALAEREGWTIDELADRTIPDAGFARPTDEEGRPTGSVAELILDYGPRSFVVKLDDELEPVITRDDGKVVKAPPAPAKSDDEAKAKEAKKAFSDAKKLVKEVVKIQSERLYEAVCTQRCWRFDDWQRYLAQHPIIGKICTRVVWSAFEPGVDGAPERFITNFRPLEDGTLTNEQDDAVTCSDETIIRIAHDCNTPAESRAPWIQHLEDYDVHPLFQQFGRAVFELPTSRGDSTEINDFQGHLLTTYKLRGKATKLGWLRGEAEDGGCFMLYRKPFPSLQLQAILEFTGSFLPEQDIAAALKSLSFEAIRNNREEASSWSRSAMPLKKIPPVLLSEVYNDVRQIAAEGTGFDPDWEKKSYF